MIDLKMLEDIIDNTGVVRAAVAELRALRALEEAVSNMGTCCSNHLRFDDEEVGRLSDAFEAVRAAREDQK